MMLRTVFHWPRLLQLCIALGAAAAIVAGWVLLAPLPPWVEHPVPSAPVRIEDRSGTLLYESRGDGEARSDVVALEELPPDVVRALLFAEDRSFFSHHGVSVRGIVRSMLLNIRSLRLAAGGSTITQQYVRASRGGGRSMAGKLTEVLYALQVDARLSKETILRRYLGLASFGHGTRGIEAAARTYFGVAASELSLAQGALLVSILPAPSAFDLFANFPAAKFRQERLLRAMADAGELDAEAAEAAMAESLTLAPDRTAIQAPHFSLWALAQAGDAEPGTSIRTTLDLNLQREVERLVRLHVERLVDFRATSAAVVVLDARNGDILSMVGSADYFDAEHDGAVNVAVSSRQPGSALKPFTYALALADGDTPATTVEDIGAAFQTQDGNPYTPRNYDYDEHGLVRYREALANSYNIAAVRVLEKVGVDRLLLLLRAAGLTTLTESPEHYGLALTLGSGEVRLLDLAAAYGMFARGGRTLHPRALLDDPVRGGTKLLDERVAWLIADMLDDDAARMPQFGRGGPLEFAFPVAAKTGTTRNARDNWVVGFTPSFVVGVWVGNADNTPMRGTSGVTGAGPLFHDVVALLEDERTVPSFARPPGITDVDVCALSGKLPTPACTGVLREHFIAGTEPVEPDDAYVVTRIDTRNGLLAGPSCPPRFVQEATFFRLPPGVRAWGVAHGMPPPPERFSPLCTGTIEQTPPQVPAMVRIVRPVAGESLRLDPLIPPDRQQMMFRADADGVAQVEWFVDGVAIGIGTAPDFAVSWAPREGRWMVEAHAGDAVDRRAIEVVR